MTKIIAFHALCHDCNHIWNGEAKETDYVSCPKCDSQHLEFKFYNLPSTIPSREQRIRSMITRWVVQAYKDYMSDDDASGHHS